MTFTLNRRHFNLALSTGLLAGLMRPLTASAQVVDPRPPLVDTSNPHEVADGVFVVRDNRIWLVPNIGIIIGKDAALVVDCGLGPVNGERVLVLAKKLAGSRRLLLTITHFHPEHGYGAQVFKGNAEIVYNSAQRDELSQKGENYIDLFKNSQGRAAAAALDGMKIVMPDQVYDGRSTTIDLGGRTVELRNWTRTAHTRGDQIVWLLKERILFAGDLIEERMFPIFPYFPPSDVDVDGANWVSDLRDVRLLEPKLIIPGHGDPGGLEISNNLLSQIDRVASDVRSMRAKGMTAKEIVREYKPVLVAAYPDWEHPGLIDWQLNYFSAIS